MKSICVVGDVMLDRYYQGSANRLSPEGPYPIVNIHNTIDRLGGAANVALNAATFGAKTYLVGQIGVDLVGETMKTLVAHNGIAAYFLETPYPTTLKLRIQAGSHQLLRCDFEKTGYMPGIMQEYQKALAVSDAVIISDYAKGVCHNPAELIAAAKKDNKLVFVDPKQPLINFANATCITPNEKEFREFVGAWNTEEELIHKAHETVKNLGLEALLVTRSEKGMLLVLKNGKTHHIPTQAKEVFDICGAGDTVIATFAVLVTEGYSFLDAAILANKAAGITLAHLGTSCVTREEVMGSEKIFTHAEAAYHAARQREKGLKVVFTNGCFDILHPGHLAVFKEAKSQGHYLIVGLNSDASVKRLKGPNRPIYSEKTRAQMLAALAWVDSVVIFEEDTPLNVILAIKPDVLVKGGDYAADSIVGAEQVRAWGGRVHIVSFVDGLSTTKTLERIQSIG